MNGVFGFLVFLGISVVCWVMVLKPSFRRNKNEPVYYFWRLNKQGRRDLDAMYLAASLVGAMLFSMITLVFVIVAISRFLSR
jgi:hypothetical protein